MFKNREEAGLRLAEQLKEYKGEDVVILGIPRGGVLTAYALKEELDCKWDLIIPRKIGAPFNKEVAIGAVTQDGSTLLDQDMISYLNVRESYIQQETEKQINEIKRRIGFYRGDRQPMSVRDKKVILVDDGIATGFTIKAAIKSIENRGAAEIIIAVPVAPCNVVKNLMEMVDRVVCLESPCPFYAVGLFYEDFHQITDEEIIELFK